MFKSVGGRPVRPYMYDGNYVVASNHKHPWKKQLNILAGYLYFYNPIWFMLALIRFRTRVSLKPAGMQIIGMMGLAMTIVRTSGWATRLMFGRIERLTNPPASRIPMRSVDGASASNDARVASIQVRRPLVPDPSPPRDVEPVDHRTSDSAAR